MQTAIKPLSVEDLAEWQALSQMTAERFEGMSPIERAGFSIRAAINELVYNFLTARGYTIDRVKDRRGKETLLTNDEHTARAAAVLLLNTDYTD